MKKLEKRFTEKNQTTFDIKEILETYSIDDDVFSNEEEWFSNVKDAVWNGLDETERRIILLYAELGNMRDTAKALKVSPSTIYIYVSKIRIKIKEYLNIIDDK